MALAMEVQICDAIVTALNDRVRGFSRSFEAERNYLPEFKAEELREVKVIVMPWVPDEIDAEGNTAREGNLFTYRIAVCVQQAVNTPGGMDGREMVDGLCKLTEEIHDYLRTKPTLAIAGPWKVIDAQRPEAYSAGWLNTHEIFSSDVLLKVLGKR